MTNTVRYVYDGWRVVQERDGNNTPLCAYTRGNDLSVSLEGAGGIGGLLARTKYVTGNPTSSAFYFADGNGNITSLIDTNNSVVASYRYDPFGNIISKIGSQADVNVYRFSSKEVHVNSGMYYYGFRFYDPNLQRWINRDPIEEEGGINLYTFIWNGVGNWIDLFGLDGCHIWDIHNDPDPLLADVNRRANQAADQKAAAARQAEKETAEAFAKAAAKIVENQLKMFPLGFGALGGFGGAAEQALAQETAALDAIAAQDMKIFATEYDYNIAQAQVTQAAKNVGVDSTAHQAAMAQLRAAQKAVAAAKQVREQLVQARMAAAAQAATCSQNN